MWTPTSTAAMLSAALLAACAGQAANPDAAHADRGTTAGGGSFLAIVGTPFLIAFKIPVCIATVAIAAPVAGLSALAPGEQSRETRQLLGAGVSQNCGPPYALSP